MEYSFVSYSRRQLYFAESVALSLQRAGLEVWFDLQKLAPGMDWASSLKEGYSHCDKLVLIASQSAVRSPYVQVEWETALHAGRQVIVVLTEEVVLPVALQGCPVFDARTQFDRTMGSLISYLQGTQPARYDPVPPPGKYPYTLKMPFPIWLTILAMLMPTLTVWIAALSLPRASLGFDVDIPLPDFLNRLVPGMPAHVLMFYLVGLYYGFNLAQAQFPVRSFWRHDARYEELDEIRGKALWIQLVACILVFVSAVLVPGGQGDAVNPVGYLIFLCPLLTAYWSLRVFGRSPDILRWMPSGEADQEMREAIQGRVGAGRQEQPAERTVDAPEEIVRFAIHHHLADDYTARFIRSVLQSEGCQPVPAASAGVHLVLVSNRTSKGWLLKLDRTLPGQVIHILVTNINTPPELQPVLQSQWVDFRAGRIRTLRVLAAQLMDREKAEVAYGMQISPTGFDTINGFPRGVGLVIGSLFVIVLIPFPLLAFTPVSERVVLGLSVAVAIGLLLYADALIMRRISLPSFVHRVLRHRVAWFASPAPASPDMIGNSDRKYAYKLSSTILRDT
jgi:hypothetical protein